MVSLSRWWILFALVAKLGSSSRRSAAYGRTERVCCSAVWTTSRSALGASVAHSRAHPCSWTAASTISRSPFSASAANWRAS
eukprot:3757861-Amphidinium_carterae.1